MAAGEKKMNKNDKELLGEKIIKLFSVMRDHSAVYVEKIKQLRERNLYHELVIRKNTRWICPCTIDHNAAYYFPNGNRNSLISESYEFYQNRKQKFILNSFKRGPDRYYLFSRWSKIDMQDLMDKLDLKIVETV